MLSKKIQINNTLKISVILPVYNGGRYLKESVESVLRQEESDFELLIIDDHSSDGSTEYLETLTDPRIRLFKNDINKGLFYNLNFLVIQCNTDIIKLWAQDDIMYPQCLERFIQFHKKYPNIGFSYSGRTIIDEAGNIINNNFKDNTPEIISSELHARIAFFTGSIAGNIANVCINKTALSVVGFFNENMRISADFDMWVRLAEKYNTGFIKEPLIFLRDHKGQLSRKEEFYIDHVKEDLSVYRHLFKYVTPDMRKEGRQLLRRHKMVFYYTLMLKSFAHLKFRTGFSYIKEMSATDNFLLVSLAFFKSKIIGYPVPQFLNFPET